MTAKKDLTGKRFGRLVAICDSGKRNRSNVVWKCKCDCGNYCYISGSILGRHTNSCGCLRKERLKRFVAKHPELIKKSNKKTHEISHFKRRKINKSGIVGVHFDKSRNKWVADLENNKKLFLKKRFKNKQDAINARLETERKYLPQSQWQHVVSQN
ncbi:hypothetical protein BN20_032 [Lactobacillus phage EV3]|nr:hypothetical protein BN20_032 [Lactobacillus phage EV3]